MIDRTVNAAHFSNHIQEGIKRKRSTHGSRTISEPGTDRAADITKAKIKRLARIRQTKSTTFYTKMIGKLIADFTAVRETIGISIFGKPTGNKAIPIRIS